MCVCGLADWARAPCRSVSRQGLQGRAAACRCGGVHLVAVMQLQAAHPRGGEQMHRRLFAAASEAMPDLQTMASRRPHPPSSSTTVQPHRAQTSTVPLRVGLRMQALHSRAVARCLMPACTCGLATAATARRAQLLETLAQRRRR